MEDKKEEQQSRSVGRGSLLQQVIKTRQQEQAVLSSESFPRPSVGYGRSSLLNMVKATKGTETVGHKGQEPMKTVAQGRASLLNLIKKTQVPGQSRMIEQEVPEQASTSVKEFSTERRLNKLSIQDTASCSSGPLYEGSEVISRRGTSGNEILMTANYIDLKQDPRKGRFMYEVKYSPEIDSIVLKRKLLQQHSAALGRNMVFDGILLYLPEKLPQDRTIYKSIHPSDESPVSLTLIFKRKATTDENILFFNVLLNRIMRILQLVKIGQLNCNPLQASYLPEHSLEVWPGYVTAINEFEGGLKLCIDPRHRVMCTRTVYDLMKEIAIKDKQTYKESIMMELLGNSVLTRYNNKTYRIDDIDWDTNPTLVFNRKGEEISLVNYYKSHWNLTIKHLDQPLLVHRGKEKLPTGEVREKCVLLVPELCHLSGLTDSVRSDFKIMKALDSVTRMTPNTRCGIIQSFVQQVQNTEKTREMLAQWGLELDTETTKLTGRVLKPENLTFGQQTVITVGPNADWGNEVTRKCMLVVLNLSNWCILHTKRDARVATDFISMLQREASGMGMKVSNPNQLILSDDRTDTYLKVLRRNINDNIEMVVVIFPTNRNDRYSAIKKMCCVEMPVPSQVVMTRTISRSDKLRSVTQKIALQMNCKLGGALWSVNIPFAKYMICGIDVYHAVEQRKRGSVAGFVASIDTRCTTWYSKTCMQSQRQELVDLLQICFISAIKLYKERNGYYPDRIIIYRDGVSDNQVETVGRYEIRQFLTAFTTINPNYKPHLSVLIVQKRINTRLFRRTQDDLANPPPGTVIDSCVTRKYYYDFFLVSQNVRQGTVTPTHYIVVYDSSNMKPDHMQRLTYKMCHLYYNWPGTIRVPAPCQYAHKLAYLVGQSIQMEPHSSLNTNLYYL